MKKYAAFLAFIGNFFPVFVITYVVYVGYTLSIWLAPVILTLFFNLIWLRILSKKELMGKPNSSEENYNISEVREMGLDVIAYFLSYSISLPAILFLPPSKGIFILGVMLILIYLLLNSNKIMLFNPFLSVFGYNEFEVRTKTGTPFYIISKEKLKVDSSITVFKIYSYIYYYEPTPDIG
jgi:hypothetical protein